MTKTLIIPLFPQTYIHVVGPQWKIAKRVYTWSGLNVLKDEDFLDTPKEGIEQHTVDTPKEGIELHRKLECLKSGIGRGKAYFLGSKWTQKKVDKASDKTISQTYVENRLRKLNEKCEETGKTLEKNITNLYSAGISRVIKIKDVKKLR